MPRHRHLLAGVFVTHEGMLKPAGHLGHRIAAQPLFNQAQHQIEHRPRPRNRGAPPVAQNGAGAGLDLGEFGLERRLIAPVHRTAVPVHQPGSGQREDAAGKAADPHPRPVQPADQAEGMARIGKFRSGRRQQHQPVQPLYRIQRAIGIKAHFGRRPHRRAGFADQLPGKFLAAGDFIRRPQRLDRRGQAGHRKAVHQQKAQPGLRGHRPGPFPMVCMSQRFVSHW